MLNVFPGHVVDTAVAGLFLLLPDLLNMDIEEAVCRTGSPKTRTMPAVQYVLSLLAL